MLKICFILLYFSSTVCGSSFGEMMAGMMLGEKTITAYVIKNDETFLCFENKPYSDQIKFDLLNTVANNLDTKDLLKIEIKKHIKHESITEFYGSSRFSEEEKSFSDIINLPKLILTPIKNLTKETTYYVDYKDGSAYSNTSKTSGLGLFRQSLKPAHEKKKIYFIATGIQDCIFMTVFNKKNAKSFNIHINASYFIDENAHNFETFLPNLEENLVTIKGESDNSDLQITLISSYLSTGIKYIYEAIVNRGYSDSNIQVNYMPQKETEKFFIRKVGPMVNPERFDKNNLYYRSWTRPIEVFLDPKRYPNPNTRLVKDVVFNAMTGEHYILKSGKTLN
jgi:hypothetical protein